MIRCLVLISYVFWAASAVAQDTGAVSVLDVWGEDRSVVFNANEVDIEALQWIARPVVVFADGPDDPRLRQQLEYLLERPGELAERDVIILVDTDPAARGAWRLRLRPRGFSLVIMGKDGEVELRKPAPWDVREISRTIDKMPLRQQEVEERRRVEP